MTGTLVSTKTGSIVQLVPGWLAAVHPFRLARLSSQEALHRGLVLVRLALRPFE